MLYLMYLLANNLYSYKQEVLGFEVDISVRYKVMAMLLNFDEKWKTSFNVLYKHGMSW